MNIGFLTPEYVTPTAPEGGLANYIRKVGSALVSLGHEVSVFALSHRDQSWKDGQIAVYELKRPVLPMWPKGRPFRSLATQLLSSKRLQAAVFKVHGVSSFDVLQASSYQVPGYMLRHNRHVALVCRISSYSPLWRAAYGTQRRFGDYLCDWLEIRQVVDADASFAPSRFIAETFARLEGHQPEVIRTPIDIDETAIDPSFYRDHISGGPYLLFFGTLSRIKGTDLLRDVIPPVLERHRDLSFVFVGRDDGFPGVPKMFDYISSRSSGVEGRLHWFAPLPKAQLYPIITNALGVVMPSRVDNYPNACLEAQSLGVPVVGTYDSSLDEMIVDGETGFLARNGDPYSLRQAVETLLAMNSPERKQMKQLIGEHVRSISSQDRVGQLLSLYESTIDKFQPDS